MNKPARAHRRSLNAVLLLDKPGGLTSNAALQRAKHLLNAAKAGHTGTLDPMATGLLPLCFGDATKFSTDLLNADKTYEAVIALGSVTDTGDADGQVLRSAAVEVTRAAVDAVLARFRGPIMQLPPMYSALKHEGKALYAYAREGVDIERSPREVTIRRLDLVELSGASLRVEVACSKGTYIRTLAQDIGEALGCGAHLAGLRRTHAGPLDIASAVSLEELERMPPEERERRLLPVDTLVAGLPMRDLDADAAQRFIQGQTIPGKPTDTPGEVRVYAQGRFLGVGRQDAAGLAPRRLLAQRTERHFSGDAGTRIA